MRLILQKVFLTLFCMASLCATTLATGWMMIVFFWLFGLCFILQLFMIWQPPKQFDNWVISIFLTTLLLCVFYLFREDFSSAARSHHTPIFKMKYLLGMEEHYGYNGPSNSFEFLLNLFFIPLLGYQIYVLVKMRKEKKMEG